MAQDIVPIELGLTDGNLLTLWAPRWREEGEEWEAFLGFEEDLYAFDDVAHLAAFVRTTHDHDLIDHPAWQLMSQVRAIELLPEETQVYDLIAVPELMAEEPDTSVINALADIIAMVRSIAEVCDLTVVDEVLAASDGFAVLEDDSASFSGREGQRLWAELTDLIAERWDEVIDAIDELVVTPEVDAKALAAAEEEVAAAGIGQDDESAEETDEEDAEGADTAADDTDAAEDESTGEAEPEEEESFWQQVGMDPIRIVTDEGEYYTLRCYLDDDAVFLGESSRIEVFGSPRALGRYLADPDDNDLMELSTWADVVEKATAGELEVTVDNSNSYVLTGLDEDLGEGPQSVDPVQLELAVELLRDADEWAGSDTVDKALAGSEPLGWLVSFILQPDPNRLAPSPPFHDEVAAWRSLVDDFTGKLRAH